jgi:FolB domain-containing protein
MDILRVSNLCCSGRHGYHEAEREQPQAFRVSVALYLELQATATSDDLSQGVNWAGIRKGVKKIVEGESLKLVETLAWRILLQMFEYPAVSEAEVTVEKLEAWEDAIPSITFRRLRSEL